MRVRASVSANVRVYTVGCICCLCDAGISMRTSTYMRMFVNVRRSYAVKHACQSARELRHIFIHIHARAFVWLYMCCFTCIHASVIYVSKYVSFH
jgi:hypothetical protein